MRLIRREMMLTLSMLIGGTTIIVFGEEIGLNEKSGLMSWTSEQYSGGFSSCSSIKCREMYSQLREELPSTNVKVRLNI